MNSTDSKIISVLCKNKDGLMLIEIAAAIKKTRHTTGRYLDRLVAEGRIKMQRRGTAKFYKIRRGAV